MDKDQIHLSDIKRILLGEAPVNFLLEVFLRSIVAYIVLLVVVKLLGKRMSGRLTSTEIAVMLMFGAIVSGIMQIPDRGVIEGSFGLVIVILLQRLVTLWTTRNKKFEDIVLGKMNILIRDGVMLADELAKEKISRNQLFAMLRSKKISQLGEVKRLYMETSGSFSIFQADTPPPGLSVLPDEDESLYNSQETEKGKKVCYDCGTLYDEAQLPHACTTCKGRHFIDAVKTHQ